MKKMILSLALIVSALPFLAQAQTDFQKGTVVTAANEKLDGIIRDQTKNKGTILFASATGQKKIYTPAEIASYSLNGAVYISYSSDFYKVVSSGKASLYQRVTDNSGKMLYNGAEVVSVTTAEGKSGDFYIQAKADGAFVLVTAKNFEAATLGALADCAVVVGEIKSKQVDFSQLVKLVEHYNSCK